MSSANRVTRILAGALLAAHIASGTAVAQSRLEYAKRVDSLAGVWQSAKLVAGKDTVRANALPADSIRVGPIIVRADSEWSALGRTTAERLAPVAIRAYGAFAERLVRHQFMVRDKGGIGAGASVVSGVVDSDGRVQLRGSDYADADALLNSWQRKTELIIADEMGPAIRDWLRAIIPLDSPTRQTWSDARVALILSGTQAAMECVHGNVDRCSQVLGTVDVTDPAFTLFDARSRLDMIQRYARILRLAHAQQFERCTESRIEAACDSLVRSIPPDAVPSPVSPVVRQSFARFALMLGGDGAFDRFIGGASPRARIEAAAKMPADSVIRRWRDTILDSRSSSSAIDLETGISALIWVAACGAFALRSSRWR